MTDDLRALREMAAEVAKLGDPLECVYVSRDVFESMRAHVPHVSKDHSGFPSTFCGVPVIVTSALPPGSCIPWPPRAKP